jgi:hypothetical protein
MGAGAAVAAAATSGIVIARREGVGAELRLNLVEVRHRAPATTPGRLPARGAVVVPFGQLESPSGEPLGSLQSVLVPGAGDRSVLHTLSLSDGSLVGIGPYALEAPYTVVGGSGRYEGATGSYTLTPLDERDDEAHSIVLNLHLPEA